MRRYLPVMVAVLLLGVGLALYPEIVEMHAADEQVTLWTQTGTTSKALYGASQGFSFRTGPLSMDEDGFMPVLEITSSGGSAMNATVVDILNPEAFAAPMNRTGEALAYLLEDTGSFDMEIEVYADAESPVQVTAVVFYFRHVPSWMVIFYPYRFFGVGMAAVGLLALAFVYVRGRDEARR